MNNQDFEAYADFKLFNQSIPDVFKKILLEIPFENRASYRILDIGCGDGKFFKFLVTNGFKKENIYGTEVSQKRIDRCHMIGWSNVFWAEDFFTSGEKNFDIIIMLEVIEHVPKEKIASLLERLKVVLKHGTGFFYLTTPQYPIKRFYDFYDVLVWSHFYKFKDDPTHVAKYTYNELENLLNRYFKVERLSGFKDGFLIKKIRNEYLRHKIFLRLSIE